MKDQNKKRKNQNSFLTSSKRLKYPTNGKTTSTSKEYNIEEIFLKFPIIGTNILNQIDNKSLIKLMDTNRMISTFIQNERQTWIRDIIFYLYKTNKFNTKLFETAGPLESMEFYESWKKVIKKTPVEMIKELANVVKDVHKNHDYYNNSRDYLAKLSPLHFVASNKKSCFNLCQHIMNRIESKCLKNGRGETPLHIAAKNGHLDLCKLMVKRGLDVDSRDIYGMTPLHFAADHGNFKLFKFIYDNASEKDPKSEGCTKNRPLHYAVGGGHLEICRFLIKNSIDKNPAQANGYTAFECAVAKKHVEVSKLFVKNGIDVNFSSNSTTPLSSAAGKGLLKLCKFLIKHGADMTLKDSKGMTPLHKAAQNGHLEVCKFFVKIGADQYATDKNGDKPIDVAIESGPKSFEVFRFLRGSFLYDYDKKDWDFSKNIGKWNLWN